MRQEPNMKVAEGAGLTMDNIDFEFMTRGDPIVQAKDTAGRFQQNLTPEEINEMAELAPYAEKFMILTIKGETGKMPSQEDVDQLLQQTTQEMGSTNEQGMAIEQGSGAMVPQDMQTKRKVPSRPVEDKMLENAVPPTDNAAPIDRMMSGGGKVVDISDILEGDKPDWLIRALDPSTEMTKNNESIRSLTGSMDGRQILIPSIRMVDGELVRYKPEEAFRIAREKQDYLVIPAKSDEEAEAYSKELSNEISRRRGMQMGGVAAGPIGVVDKPGADNSGVADDVPAESDGFIINAAAVRHAGLRDINDMIQDAKKYAEKQGMKLNFGKTPTDAEQILVSNGEVVIPDVIANIIGYDRLEKINNRGKKETEEMIANQEQQQQTQPVMQVARGGGIFPAEDALIESQMEDFGGISPRIEMIDSDDVYGNSFDTMYDAIAEFEWRGQKPQFGFVAVKRTDKVPSSAFGPAQIVGDTTKDIINNPTKYNLNDKDIEFANKLQAAQTLFINLSNGYKKRGTFEGRRAGNTKFGKVALQTLGIDLNKFDSLVKDGYFLPSNQKNSKGLPEEIFGSSYEQNYKNLFQAVVKSKLNRSDVTDLNSFLEKYHGSTTDVKSNTFYRDGVLKILGK